MSDHLPAIRILHLVTNFSKANTGVAATVSQLSGWQVGRAQWVGVLSMALVDINVPEGVHIFCVSMNGWLPCSLHPVKGIGSLIRVLRENKVTHLHVHGVWTVLSVLGILLAASRGLPVVLSVHGMWAPAALSYGGRGRQIKKIAYWNLFARWLVPKRVALHAVTRLEARHILEFSGRPASVTLPNAINLTESPFQNWSNTARPSKKIVYLGRLHPIKGPDLLIKAFSESKLDGAWELLIAGPEEIPIYAKKLKAQASASEKSSQIRFLGTCYGFRKHKLLADAWVVVVPSHSEVVGMVNLEAAGLYTPTITTYATGLSNWQTGGGLLSEATSDGLRAALNAVMDWTIEERLGRGCCSRELVEKEFSLDSVGTAWLAFYIQLLNGVNPND